MFTGFAQLTTQQVNSQNAARGEYPLGTLGGTKDGSIYVRALAGATNLAAGLADISPAKVANDTNRSLNTNSNTAVGSTTLLVNDGGTVAVGAYNDGFLCVNDGAGVGQCIQIVGNSADDGTSNHVVTVQLAEGLITALSTSTTKVVLVPNAYSNTIVHPGSSTAYFCAGVNELAITAANYYWSKLRGPTSVLADGITAKGIQAVLTTNAIAGAVITQGSNTTVKPVGVAPEATVDTKYYPLFLTLI